MKRLISYITALMLLSQAAFGQLTIDASLTPQQLVEDVLVGQGVEVSNFQFLGNVEARGYFDGSNSNIGVSEGIILSTGRVADAPGPNTIGASEDEGTNFGGQGEATLTAISQLQTNDAAVLSFDFIPTSDTIQFNYVFASNEYIQWVDQNYNDVFAFLISGPGIVGEQNVALVPGTTTPVSINTINDEDFPQFYIDNGDETGEQGGATVNYNGFTTVLTATAIVQACETYRIRLAIADGGDGTIDSAVFLEAGSFSSPTISIEGESNYSASGSRLELVEGCSDLTLTFERSEPYTNPLSVDLLLTGTATNGDDITNIPTNISFAPGQSVATISFNVLEDNVPEGTETMRIELDLDGGCGNTSDSYIEFDILDAQPMSVSVTPDVNLDCPEERIIDLTVTDGYQPYDIEWTNSTETDESITVFPFTTTTYTATVTDACGFTETAASTINLLTYQVMEVELDDAVACEGNQVTLEAIVSGGRQPLSFSWPDGSSANTYTYTPLETETIMFEVTDDCNITESATSEVTVTQVEVDFTAQLIDHATVVFTPETRNVYNFSWDFGDDSTSTQEIPTYEYQEAGEYEVTLTVIDRDGCEAEVIDTVTVYDALRVYVPNAFTPNGDSLNDWFGVVGQGYLWYDLEIADRWGSIILSDRFTTENAWDGKLNGRLVPADMYVYKLWVQPPIGIEVKEVGVINVLPDTKK